MKTLAELKREANSGKITLEIVYRYGKEIPERIQGERKIAKVNTVGMVLVKADGTESRLELGAASLIEYDGETLTIYDPGKRELTAEEQAIYNGWLSKQEEIIKNNPFADTYWQEIGYYEQHKGFEYLRGCDKVRGKRLTHQGRKPIILDDKIKGEKALQYIVRKVA